jgi:4-hydroxy-tetrahydrodipicolinate reductase
MAIRVCIAGATGWTGSAVTGAILASSDFQLVSAVARRQVGADIGEALDLKRANVPIVASLEEALAVPTDVLIDYTTPEVVKDHILAALDKGVRVVVGTSGLTASDYSDIEQRAQARRLGVIAAGNFSITAALAKHFSLIAAQYLPSWEIIDYASAAKSMRPAGPPANRRKNWQASRRTSWEWLWNRPTVQRKQGEPTLTGPRCILSACPAM